MWRRPVPTIRLRLTAVYGGLFLASGATLLAITYVLVRGEYTGRFFVRSGGKALTGISAESSGGVTAPTQTFHVPSPAQLAVVANAQSGAALHQLLVDSAIALAIMTVLSIWLGWLIAGRALRPLRTITKAAREISATSLHRRLSLEGPKTSSSSSARPSTACSSVSKAPSRHSASSSRTPPTSCAPRSPSSGHCSSSH